MLGPLRAAQSLPKEDTDPQGNQEPQGSGASPRISSTFGNACRRGSIPRFLRQLYVVQIRVSPLTFARPVPAESIKISKKPGLLDSDYEKDQDEAEDEDFDFFIFSLYINSPIRYVGMTTRAAAATPAARTSIPS